MNHEQAVSPATAALTALVAAVDADLDEQAGGIGWWNDQVGWRRSALIGDYLLASCFGTSESLLSAALAIDQHARAEYADNHWIRTKLEHAARSGSRDIWRELARGPKERERSRLLELYRERGLSSLATSLDRLAAVVAAVAGVKLDLLTIGWGSLRNLAEVATGRTPPGKPAPRPPANTVKAMLKAPLCDPGTPGRDRQNALLGLLLDWDQFGPPDWLPWLLKARHTTAHRAPLSELMAVFGTRAYPGGEGLTRPFWRQPAWSDTESFVKVGEAKVDGLFIVEHPNNVLSGLLDSSVRFTAAIAEACLGLWLDRRSDPALIVQDGGAWAEIAKEEPLDFNGYGSKLRIVGNQMTTSPAAARRLRATKVFDADRPEWNR